MNNTRSSLTIQHIWDNFYYSISALRRKGTISLNGLPAGSFDVPIFETVLNRYTVRGSVVGTRKDMQEAIAFALEGKVKTTVHAACRKFLTGKACNQHIYNMKRRKFLNLAGGSIFLGGVTCYLLSDKSNFVRADSKQKETTKILLKPDERVILFLASLAPSGHNTQPWFVRYLEPFHWIIGNDKSRWLNAVDPTQRETILSIGAFLQNLEYAASHLGYSCQLTILAASNQDENIVEVKLNKAGNESKYDIEKIKHRRTVRSDYLTDVLKKEDVAYLINEESDFIHYISNSTKEHQWLNEQTIEANKIQSYRDAAQGELANWIRFSSKEAEKNEDGLTLAGMEIEGIQGWLLRNFYGKENVMKKSFRNEGIDKVVKQVSQSAGWILITSKDNSVTTLLETGKRLQRLLLKIRERNIAIHPMTQVIEEAQTNQILNTSIGITEPVQFILRTGYLKNYPEPVTLRRSVDKFIMI